MSQKEAGGTRVTATVRTMMALLIFEIVFATLLIGTLLHSLLNMAAGQQLEFDLPLAYRAVGGVLVLIGVAFLGSTLRVRKPRDILVSTSVTFLKFLRRKPLENLGARTEPFIPTGPYRWVRNPMYFAALMLPVGLGVLFSSLSFLLWGLALLAWVLILVRREEEELEALFGDSYRNYKRQVPMLFPTGRRYKG